LLHEQLNFQTSISGRTKAGETQPDEQIEKIKEEDRVGEFQVNKMTVNLEQKEMKPAAKITEEK
jgi:hypothetical protein